MDLIHWLHAKYIYGFVVRWLQAMTERCEAKWSLTDYQIDNIIIPAMQGMAKKYSAYANELNAFIPLSL